jgi:DNA-binding transcriptional LysR family regulator
MELYQVRYYLALCDTLNFARAAEKCHVSQPSLTRAVQKLEQELGGLLIRRERRRTHLTELGELLRPMLQEVLSHADLTQSAARTFLGGDKRTLKLGILSSIWPVQFVLFLTRFAAQHRSIQVTLVEADSATLRERLLGGDLDYAVGACGNDAQGRLRSHLLYREGVVAVIPLGHPFEQRDTVRVRDLEGVDLLLQTNCEMRSTLIELCRQQAVEPNIIYRSERKDWIQTMVAAGAGITIMPEYSRFPEGTLVRRLIEPALVRAVSLVVVAGRAYDPSGNLLLRAIRAQRWGAPSTSGADAARRVALKEVPRIAANASAVAAVRNGASAVRLPR